MSPFSLSNATDGKTASPANSARRACVGFLFNHEQAHQIPHSAPILSALAAMNLPLDLHAFVATPAHMKDLTDIVPAYLARRVQFHDIPPGRAARIAERLVGGAIPVRRMGALVRHRKLLRSMDVLVAPETTSIMLKTHLGCGNVKLVYTQHGAGDRAVGFKKIIGQFDHVLIAGEKVRDRMNAAGIIREGDYSIVGYPKFDAVPGGARPNLFGNDKPTVLYNPHFHPDLSSWYRDGLKVLEFFARNPRYNLIFAPHVMLFSRRAHACSKPPRLKLSGHVPAKFRNCANILVDEGSRKSMDMTYTRAADIYLGDASSQVYEFIASPRPCLFLNSNGADWRDDPNYQHWHLGQVLQGAGNLATTLADLRWHEKRYLTRQSKAFEATFGNQPFGGAARAADVIARLAGARPEHDHQAFLIAAE